MKGIQYYAGHFYNCFPSKNLLNGSCLAQIFVNIIDIRTMFRYTELNRGKEFNVNKRTKLSIEYKVIVT